jgi:papain like protease
VTVTRIRIPEVVVPGKRLGRHIHIDSRSEAYPFVPRHTLALTSVLWNRRIPILDQGNLGSCTGNAITGALGTDPDFGTLSAATQATLNEDLAVKIYSKATAIDPYPGQYPPDDTGSDGIDVAKVARSMGLISGYTHATDLASMQQAIMQQPVIIGINWYDSFDNPDSNGYVTISSGAQVRGGHEIVVEGMDPGQTKMQFRAANSWSDSWGANGYFYFSFATMTRLLGEGGDVTVPLPLSVSPPQPQPQPAALDREVALNAVAGPWAAQTRTRPDLVILKNAIVTWQQSAGLPL